MAVSRLFNPALVLLLAWQSSGLLAAEMDSLDEAAYKDEVLQWRTKAENSLRADNGWLTLAGRFVMKPGENRFGTASDNDIVLPAGSGPAHVGSFFVEPGTITLKTVEGITMYAGGAPFTERTMKTDMETPQRDWVTVGRLAMHVIERSGNYVLRLADNESEVRKQFPGRLWYDVNPAYRVTAKFVPYSRNKRFRSPTCLATSARRQAPAMRNSRWMASATASTPWTRTTNYSSFSGTQRAVMAPTRPVGF